MLSSPGRAFDGEHDENWHSIIVIEAQTVYSVHITYVLLWKMQQSSVAVLILRLCKICMTSGESTDLHWVYRSSFKMDKMKFTRYHLCESVFFVVITDVLEFGVTVSYLKICLEKRFDEQL